MTNALILSVLHLALFTYYNSLYLAKRENGSYRNGKDLSFKQMPIKRKITKLAFAFNVLIVLLSFWIPQGTVGFLPVSPPVKYAGLTVSFMAVLFLRASLNYLGENYSPLFDSHRPFRIVREGPYRAIRHPIYLANMLIILGYVIAGASIWCAVLGAWGWFYMAWSISREERFLAQTFPDYRVYQQTSRRLIPFIF